MGRTPLIVKKISPKKKASPTKLGKESAASRILSAANALEKILGKRELPRKQVVSFACVKPSTELCVLSKLKMEGMLLYKKDTIQLTEEGRSQGDDPNVPQDNVGVHKYLKNKVLTGDMVILFEAMSDGKVHEHKSLGNLVDMFDETVMACVSKMASMGLVECPDKKTARLTDLCFPYGRPK